MGSLNCSHATSCPASAQGVSSVRRKLRFSQYSTPGSGVIVGKGIVTISLLGGCRLELRQRTLGQHVTVGHESPVGGRRSQALEVVEVLDLEPTGLEVDGRRSNVLIDLLDLVETRMGGAIGRDQPVHQEVVVVVDALGLEVAAIGVEGLAGPARHLLEQP